jgi:hypothetical protein
LGISLEKAKVVIGGQTLSQEVGAAKEDFYFSWGAITPGKRKMIVGRKEREEY